MQKNVAGQIWMVFAFNRTDNTPLTGDAANITGNLRIDGGAANAIDDTNPTELEDGFYYFDITQAESNGDQILISPASSTADIQVIGVPGVYDTTAPNFNALGIESDGDVTKVNLCANTTLVDTTTTNTDMLTAAAIVGTALTEAYSTKGANATLTELLYEIIAELREFDYTGTTKTVKKQDTTSAYTNTIDDATSPTASERAT